MTPLTPRLLRIIRATVKAEGLLTATLDTEHSKKRGLGSELLTAGQERKDVEWFGRVRMTTSLRDKSAAQYPPLCSVLPPD